MTTDSSSPVTIAGVDSPVALAIGEYHICGLLPGGGVKCWGFNYDGELGIGLAGPSISPAPVDVIGVATAITVDATSLGNCATLADGSARCWGFVDVGDGASAKAQPVAVKGIAGATQAAAETNDGCALRSDGSVLCWGMNQTGQLGNGTTDYAATAVPVTATW